METTKTRKILVVGAGVIGLTTAIRLREKGHDVIVVARETPSTILIREASPLKGQSLGSYSSAGCGGLWMPFMLEGEAIERWSTAAHEEFTRQRNDNVGVSVLTAFMLCVSQVPEKLPWYGKLTDMSIETSRTDPRIPSEYPAGFRFSTPIVQMGPYMMHLEERARGLGVEIELTAMHAKDKQAADWNEEQVASFALSRFQGARPIVINCLGIGAGKLADDELIPGRGIIVRVKRPADKRYMISEDPHDGLMSKDGLLAYSIPRGDEYSLGGSSFLGDWHESVSEEEARGVVERANKLLPGINSMERTGVWCGLRPMRKSGTARVEVQHDGLGRRADLDVIANYGHGGSGVTVCWGCADEVVQIVEGLDAS